MSYKIILPIMKRTLIFIFIILATSYSAAFACSKHITISDVWARPSHGKSLTSAIYMKIENKGKLDYITGADTDVAKMTELHKTVTEQGISQMVHINRLALPKETVVELKPKGLHIMLMGLHKPLKPGDKFSLVISFENAGEMTVGVPVKNSN